MEKEYLLVAVTAVVVFTGLGILMMGDEEPEFDENITFDDDEADTLHSTYSFDQLNDNIRSGGVPQDGIPSIDDPQYIEAEESEMDDGDIVFGVEYEGEVKAYPQHILVSHEIVNDEFNGEDVAITYCPLTATAMGQKTGGGEVGVSGNLLNSNLVMYDRETESYWPQIMSTAISGDRQGESMDEFRVVWTTWGEWRDKHSDTEVLSEDTGFLRDYENDPYGDYNPRSGYYDSSSVNFPLMAEDDSRHPKEMVLGYRNSEGAASFDYDLLRDEEVVGAEIGGQDYVLVYEEELDTGRLYENPEGMEVESTDQGYQLDGEIYTASDLPLEEQPVFDAFWFSWNAFYPEADIYE